MKVLDTAKLSSVAGGRFLVMPRVFSKPEWQKWLDILNTITSASRISNMSNCTFSNKSF